MRLQSEKYIDKYILDDLFSLIKSTRISSLLFYYLSFFALIAA